MPVIVKFHDGAFRPDQPRLIAQGDMRDMRRGLCTNCRREWWAPVIGKCPQCGSGGTVELEQKMSGAPRA